jgi:hypothetical protein
MHIPLEKVIDLKATKGISMTYLNDIVADDKTLYSVVNVFAWLKGPSSINAPDIKSLLNNREETVFLMLFVIDEDDKENLSNHLATIKKYNGGLAFLDSVNRAIHYSNPKAKT